MVKICRATVVLAALLFLGAICIGAALGAGIAATLNIKNNENFTEFTTALSTKLLDINGELITEFASDEKREIISLQRLPQHMIDALITREDKIFFEHRGFSVKAVLRAVAGKLTGRSLGGGSTLTQQIAGTLYCDRTEISLMRKIKELWWAIQMERRYSKNEILELYLNRIYFGGGTYGVNAASKYYFGHDATQITPAEAAILVIQLSNPAFYNPFDHPNRAMNRQQDVLNSMVEAGYLTRAEADESFNNYWLDFDYTRTSTSAYFMRDDKAPWFSEYVRRELGNMIYGAGDIYTSGFTVNTTLDLRHQRAAQEVMDTYIARANRLYQQSSSGRMSTSFSKYIPITELLSLTFDLPAIKVSEQRTEAVSRSKYINEINPVIDIMSLMFGMEGVKIGVVNRTNSLAKQAEKKTTIEGTMISIDNETGYITALVGGSKFDQENQFIRAVQAKLQPGSTFKPLYYSAAIDSKKFTAATEISDTPVVFYTADGKPYIPQNFKGAWMGNVQLWYALAHSMNVPSLKVLDGIGFDAAIKRSVALLGIPKEELPSRAFIPGYPLGLGVCAVRPIEMARAFAIFANGGREITPIAIRSVEDKNGNVILNPERDILEKQKNKGGAAQIITPQTAFVMTKLLQNTVDSGTLAWGLNRQSTNWKEPSGSKLSYKDEKGKTYRIPAAGKTGTTQNWADAWTVGYTPYYTAAFWFGFDKPGQSLGLSITGSTLAGVAWGDYFGEIHSGLPFKDFTKPLNGVIEVTICSESGGLVTPECGKNTTRQWFLEGTQPTQLCSVHGGNSDSRSLALWRIKREMYQSGAKRTEILDTSPLKVDLSFLEGKGSVQEEDDEDEFEDRDDYKKGPDYNFLLN
ncbi:penicillin-binding protein 1A [Treponema parvum]|uniref:penicillin-binding protein 1A n=1 Tax=Treponema parvum TaxID=138851 RepID=UPI001AEBBABE|nr:PBP1A family penicillin-binding protein [Treponema parvum]QTQ16478.1 PBP1A family penicillin-binding protein [Treponema parvum]